MVGYVSTSGSGPVSLEEAVLQSLPPDGGLYVPTRPLEFSWPPPDVVSTPEWAAPLLLPDLEPEVVRSVAADACNFPFPLIELDAGRFVLELFHGPTHAFKDVGARFMANLVSRMVTESGRSVTVLVATSGDTGGAVASAFLGRSGTRVVALFPQDGVSERQRRQMTTLGDNVEAVAVSGTFDDCQRLVKAAFVDEEISQAHGLTSANSINVARLLPQAIYFLDVTRHISEPAHFVVPSGNLGNLCAGLISANAGMPNAGFTAAFNRNHGIVDFLRGDPFEAKASVPTVSNAMDVGDPSNLERIRWLYGNDDDAVRHDVRGDWVSDEETVRTIAEVHARTGYVMDPHTAVAHAAASRLDAAAFPIVTLATAHPGKFPEVVQRAIGAPVETPLAILEASERNEVMSMIRPNLEELRDLLDRRHL